jgi:hypothetical protein
MAFEQGWTPAMVFDATADEVRSELLLSRRAAEAEVDTARQLAEQPRIAAWLAAGRIDRWRVVILLRTVIDLSPEHAAKLLDGIDPALERCTASELMNRARRLAIALDPGWAERRLKAATKERHLEHGLAHDGSAFVTGVGLPPREAGLGWERIHALAAAARRRGAAQTQDYLAAEVFLALLDGRLTSYADDDIVDYLVTNYPPVDADNADARPAPDPENPPGPAPGIGPTTPDADAVEDAEPDREPTEPGAASGADETGAAASRTSAVATAGQPGRSGLSRGLELRVGLGTLLGLDEYPGELPGWGYLPPGETRRIAADAIGVGADWRYVLHDEDGHWAGDGTTRHRPKTAGPRGVAVTGTILELTVPLDYLTDAELRRRFPDWASLLDDLAAQHRSGHATGRAPQNIAARFPSRPTRRRVQIRLRHCVFPGCRAPATSCDIDHESDWARSHVTSEEGLAPACRHDHEAKTKRGWTMTRLDQNTIRWTSHRGRHHRVTIDPVAPPLPEPIRRCDVEPEGDPDPPD